MVRARSYRLTAPEPVEHSVQAAICRTLGLEICAPGKLSKAGVTWFCVDHSNYGGEVPGARLGRGIIAGIPDLLLLFKGRSYFIEIKRAYTGSLSGPQQWLLPVLAAAGSRIGVARDVPETLALLDEWQIPRAKRVRIAA